MPYIPCMKRTGNKTAWQSETPTLKDEQLPAMTRIAEELSRVMHDATGRTGITARSECISCLSMPAHAAFPLSATA